MENLHLTEAALKLPLEAAQARAALADGTEPRARSAHYDPRSGNVIIHLKDGSSFTVPHQLLQGLAGAEAQDLAAIEITPSGGGIHWETLDVHLRVPSLLQGVYGTKNWMEKLRQQSRQMV
jgi:Protein of unknown function (DUF2442)